jgi:hypothetical protein
MSTRTTKEDYLFNYGAYTFPPLNLVVQKCDTQARIKQLGNRVAWRFLHIETKLAKRVSRVGRLSTHDYQFATICSTTKISIKKNRQAQLSKENKLQLSHIERKFIGRGEGTGLNGLSACAQLHQKVDRLQTNDWIVLYE